MWLLGVLAKEGLGESETQPRDGGHPGVGQQVKSCDIKAQQYFTWFIPLGAKTREHPT